MPWLNVPVPQATTRFWNWANMLITQPSKVTESGSDLWFSLHYTTVKLWCLEYSEMFWLTPAPDPFSGPWREAILEWSYKRSDSRDLMLWHLAVSKVPARSSPLTLWSINAAELLLWWVVLFRGERVRQPSKSALISSPGWRSTWKHLPQFIDSGTCQPPVRFLFNHIRFLRCFWIDAIDCVRQNCQFLSVGLFFFAVECFYGELVENLNEGGRIDVFLRAHELENFLSDFM